MGIIPAPLITKIMEPSNISQAVTFENKVTVSVPAGILNSKQTLAIAPLRKCHRLLFAGIGEMAGYTITLGNLQEFNKPLIIEMAYDPAKAARRPCSSESALCRLLGYNTEFMGVFAGHSGHPTQYCHYHDRPPDYMEGLLYPPRLWCERSDHFLVVYDRQIPAIIGSKQVTGSVFASDVSGYLETSFTAYSKAGFKMPSGQAHVL